MVVIFIFILRLKIFNFLVAKFDKIVYYSSCFNGHMAELVDALVSGTSGSDTLEVRVFLCPPYVKARWGCSSVDRALRSHRRGRGFESHQLHHEFSLSRTKCARLRKFSAARSLGEVWHKA